DGHGHDAARVAPCRTQLLRALVRVRDDVDEEAGGDDSGRAALCVGARVRIPAGSRVSGRLQEWHVSATPPAVGEALEFPLEHAEANHEGNGLRECGSRNCGALASDLHRSVPSRNQARAVDLQPGGFKASVPGLARADPVAVLEKAELLRTPGDRGKG